MAADHSNKAGYQVLILSMVTTVAFMFYIAFLHPGVEIDKNKKDEIKEKVEASK